MPTLKKLRNAQQHFVRNCNKEFQRNETKLLIRMQVKLHVWVNYSFHCVDFHETENAQTYILLSEFHSCRQQNLENRSKVHLLL